MADECRGCGSELRSDEGEVCDQCRIEKLEDQLAQACEAMSDRCKGCGHPAWTPFGCLDADCSLQQFAQNVTWRVR